MPLLVRKIERAKWETNQPGTVDEVSADAITANLRTQSSALSFWCIPDESSLEEAVLAVAAQFQHLDAIDVVLLDVSDLQQAKLIIEANPGTTKVKRLVETHRDIVGLTYRSLGTLAGLVLKGIAEERARRFTKGELTDILARAVREGLLLLEDLEKDARKDVSRKLT